MEHKIATALPPQQGSNTADKQNLNTPHFNQLLTTPTDEWFAQPWKQRKQVTEQALREVLTLTNSEAVFTGWSRSTTTLGKARYQYYPLTGETRKGVELSDPNGRFAEPTTIADTIAHEVAHTLSSPRAGHGPEWKTTFTNLKQNLNLNNKLTSTHTQTEAETEARLRAFIQKKLNAPWLGECPQGHQFPATRKPTKSYSCNKCSSQGDEASITYNRNLNRKNQSK